MHHNLSRIRSR